MEPALTNGTIMATCSLDVIDKFWKGRINPVGETYAIIMVPCSMDAVDKFWKGRINPVGDGDSPDLCYHHGPIVYGCSG
jgi:hypothetical protein